MVGIICYIMAIHKSLIDDKTSGQIFGEATTDKLLYAMAFNIHAGKIELNINFFLMCLGLCSAARIILALIVTELLGPLISTMLYMFNDLATFLVIYGAVIIGFTLSAMMGFQDI